MKKVQTNMRKIKKKLFKYLNLNNVEKRYVKKQINLLYDFTIALFPLKCIK